MYGRLGVKPSAIGGGGFSGTSSKQVRLAGHGVAHHLGAQPLGNTPAVGQFLEVR